MERRKKKEPSSLLDVAGFGSYRRAPAVVFDERPSDALRVLAMNAPEGWLLVLQKALKDLETEFDSAPLGSCHRCNAPATQLSFYRTNLESPYQWCDRCDPYSTTADRGKLLIVRASYGEIVFALQNANAQEIDIVEILTDLRRRKVISRERRATKSSLPKVKRGILEKGNR